MMMMMKVILRTASAFSWWRLKNWISKHPIFVNIHMIFLDPFLLRHKMLYSPKTLIELDMMLTNFALAFVNGWVFWRYLLYFSEADWRTSTTLLVVAMPFSHFACSDGLIDKPDDANCKVSDKHIAINATHIFLNTYMKLKCKCWVVFPIYIIYSTRIVIIPLQLV